MEDLAQKRKQNMKIYSIYRMLSIDHIFYYAIEFMFLVQVKKLTASDIVLASSFYGLFRMISQIPIIVIVDKLGKKKSIFISNLFLASCIFLIMNCGSLKILIIAQFIDAIGFSIKELTDTSLLNMSIPESSKKSEIYSKLEGKGLRNYYYFTSISSVLAGFLYEINPYIPIILSFILSCIASFVSLGFEEIKEAEKSEKTLNIKEDTKDLINCLKFIVKSNRLKALLLYSGVMWGIFSLMSTCIISLLKDIGAVVSLIAIISAIKEISSGVGAKKQLLFHNKLKNKTLSALLITILICMWTIGVTGLLGIKLNTAVVIIVISTIIIYFIKGVHEVVTSRYLQNFTDSNILPKIYAVNSVCRNMFRVIIGFIGAYLLNITNTANTIIIISIIFTIIVLSLISYMKTRLGLKPEEYSSEDIKL